jgi:hypothetical protein
MPPLADFDAGKAVFFQILGVLVGTAEFRFLTVVRAERRLRGDFRGRTPLYGVATVRV